MEFRDFLYARYTVSPLNLQSRFNRCGTAFRVTYTLIYSTGGLTSYTTKKYLTDSFIHTKGPPPLHQYALNP